MSDQQTTSDPKKVDLVFQGGGVKGIALVGALSAIEEQGYVPNDVAGASAGAICAALVAAGYTAAELKDVLESTDFFAFEDKGWEDRIPIAGIPFSLLTDHGIFEGRAFQAWMQGLLAAKGITKFGQLRDEDADDERFRYRLQVIVSDVTERQLLLLPKDAGIIGLDPDDLDIAHAVRMSMSIPIFFEPVTITDKTKKEHTLVDGGMLSNFPVWVFDDGTADPPWPTFGLKLVDPDPKQVITGEAPAIAIKHTGVKGLIEYLMGLVSTMTDAHDKLYLERDTFVRTITISNCGVKTTQFDLNDAAKDELYRSGVKAATDFFSTWDFEGYKREFRNRAPARRATVGQLMQKAAAKK